MLRYIPALALEQTISRNSFKLITTLGVLCGVGIAGSYTYSYAVSPLPYEAALAAGGSLLLSVLISLNLLRAFHNAYYFRGFAEGAGPKTGLTYEVARIFYLRTEDVTLGFIESPQGNELLKRLGLTLEDIANFVGKNRTKIRVSSLPLPDGQFITFKDLGLILYETDLEFKAELAERGITDTIYMGTLSWTTRRYYAYKQAKRWWAKDNLSQFAGIGREWSYGIAYLLDKFSRNLSHNSVFSHLVNDNAFASEKAVEVEKVLARTRESNLLLVGEAGVGKLDILLRVAERIRRKIAHPDLINKRFIVLDTDRLLAQFDTKQELERNFIKMMQQAERAGNVVLVIESLSAFIRGGASIGVDIPNLLETYLGAPTLNIVFTDTPTEFHHEVEQLSILQKIEIIYVDPPNLLGTERLLEDIARTYEVQYKTTLTYPALQTIATDADRYIPTGVMPDKAVDLLVEVMGAASQAGSIHVTEEFVQSYVRQKTGIPVGPIEDTERETLLTLEDKLHERVVGQEAAIKAISSAIRRARAGIQDANRPMGSFLFLGPTGVGKTETAKALAAVFFDDVDAMLRLDMSEYSGADALERLLGTAETSGALSDMMKEHPYAVLLLDEFEKGAQSAHDLFLQILDEGRYTDARGQTINMRNTIVIATSNAGSSYIIDAVQKNADFGELQEELVNHIIKAGTYRPELINRFDGVIIFKPLTLTEQEVVAKYLLDELTERIAARGYTVEISDSLIKAVAERGYNPEFGARPMRRVIQDTLEETIATKIISGALKKGARITITPEDLTPLI